MSFNQKKNIKIENDEMDIKSHLDTSLDMCGINVTEDLINRTLEAIIKQSSTKVTGIDEWKASSGRKRTPAAGIIKGFASVAAAVFILVIGFNAFRMMGGSSKSDSSNSEDYGTKSAQESDEMIAEDADDSSMPYMALSKDVGAGNKADSVEEESYAAEIQDVPAADRALTEEIKATADGNEAVSGGYGDIFTLSIGDICPIIREAAVSVDITDVTAEKSLFLSDSADIDNFYTLMENHVFTEGSEFTKTNLYIIKVNSSGAVFTMTVEDAYIITTYSFGNDVTEGRYSTMDQSRLLMDLEGLFLKYKQ
jgi:hypothetical protein